MQPQSKVKVIVTTTTFYKNPEGRDEVRFRLACELVKLARDDGHSVVIVDGSPTKEVSEELRELGARVVLQSEKGMGPGRRQVWREAQLLVSPDVSAILWTEPEKPDIVRSIKRMVSCMYEQNAHAAIPSRSLRSWETYPSFQRESEQKAGSVYNDFFPSRTDLPFDPMFGPVCFLPSELPYFTRNYCVQWGLPDTYVQHYAPIFMRLRGCKVVPVSVDFVYPPGQKAEEEGTTRAAEMVEKRLWQLEQLVAAYSTLNKHFGNALRSGL